jgi:hypothetical protein
VALHSRTVRFVPVAGAGDYVVTIRDAAGAVVAGLARKSTGGKESLTFDIGPGTYTATVEAVNLTPDAAHPVMSDPAVSTPFTVYDPNAKPPAPFSVTVTDGA